MSTFLETLSKTTLLADGATGSYLFELTGRLSEANHVYEALSADQPELILAIHAAYLRAGAQCVTTNTFGANRSKLKAVGCENRLEAVNRAGVQRAREAIARHRDQTRSDEPLFILGSVGPVRDPDMPIEGVKAAYREQLDALLGEGLDAILLETFTQLPHLLAILGLLAPLKPRPPVIAQMSLHLVGPDRQWDQSPAECASALIRAGADVVGVNCCAPWEATAFVDAVRTLDAVRNGATPLSAMPNAGGFERIDSRYMTKVNPEYLGKCIRALSENGVRLVGGCCEVHPPHIREMYNYLRSRKGGRVTVEAAPVPARPSAGPAEKRANGPFTCKILDHQFAVSVEIVPPRGTSAKAVQSKVDFVGDLVRARLADALDITDGSRGIPLLPPGDFIQLARKNVGWTPESADAIEFIPHFAARDLNIMGIQSRLMGYYFNQIHNVLFITGDPPKMSPTYPRSTAVFDVDSVAMIGYAHACLNAGVDFGGQPLGKHADPRTHFMIGTGFEPEAVNMEREVARLRQKIENGADYIMTQPAFRTEPLDVLSPFRGRMPILVGVMIMTSLSHAQRIAEIPGVVMPASVLSRLGAFDDPDDQAKVGRDIAVEQIQWIAREGWSGLYLMSPATHQPVIEVLTRARIR
jgi:methionine synthase / methylenetetrahydrofolate reductase(NADPH)